MKVFTLLLALAAASPPAEAYIWGSHTCSVAEFFPSNHNSNVVATCNFNQNAAYKGKKTMEECVNACCADSGCMGASLTQVTSYAADWDGSQGWVDEGLCTFCRGDFDASPGDNTYPFALTTDEIEWPCPSCSSPYNPYGRNSRRFAWRKVTAAPTPVTHAPTRAPTHHANDPSTCALEPWANFICPKTSVTHFYPDATDEWACRDMLCHEHENWGTQPALSSWITWTNTDTNEGVAGCFWCEAAVDATHYVPEGSEASWSYGRRDIVERVWGKDAPPPPTPPPTRKPCPCREPCHPALYGGGDGRRTMQVAGGAANMDLSKTVDADVTGTAPQTSTPSLDGWYCQTDGYTCAEGEPKLCMEKELYTGGVADTYSGPQANDNVADGQAAAVVHLGLTKSGEKVPIDVKKQPMSNAGSGATNVFGATCSLDGWDPALHTPANEYPVIASCNYMQNTQYKGLKTMVECVNSCCDDDVCNGVAFRQTTMYAADYSGSQGWNPEGMCTHCHGDFSASPGDSSYPFALTTDQIEWPCPSCSPPNNQYGRATQSFAWSKVTAAPTAVTSWPTPAPTHHADDGNSCAVQRWDDHVCPKNSGQMFYASDGLLDEWACREKLCKEQNWNTQPLVMSWYSYDGKDPETGAPKRIQACFWCKSTVFRAGYEPSEMWLANRPNAVEVVWGRGPQPAPTPAPTRKRCPCGDPCNPTLYGSSGRRLSMTVDTSRTVLAGAAAVADGLGTTLESVTAAWDNWYCQTDGYTCAEGEPLLCPEFDEVYTGGLPGTDNGAQADSSVANGQVGGGGKQAMSNAGGEAHDMSDQIQPENDEDASAQPWREVCDTGIARKCAANCGWQTSADASIADKDDKEDDEGDKTDIDAGASIVGEGLDYRRLRQRKLMKRRLKGRNLLVQQMWEKPDKDKPEGGMGGIQEGSQEHANYEMTALSSQIMNAYDHQEGNLMFQMARGQKPSAESAYELKNVQFAEAYAEYLNCMGMYRRLDSHDDKADGTACSPPWTEDEAKKVEEDGECAAICNMFVDTCGFSAGGGEADGTSDPCAGKSCGEVCSTGGSQNGMVGTAVMSYCNKNGDCVMDPKCGDTGDVGGGDTGGSDTGDSDSPCGHVAGRTRDEAIQSCRNARPEWEWTCEHGDLQDPECGEGRFFDYAKGECQAIC